jgi:hypothetical protein
MAGSPHHQQTGGLFVEEQMDHLAGRLDMLENELRYAWRALDVLSQEYIKMWERLEKMEGLLTEQQTVITQLIDLYTADSSDNADNSFDADGTGGNGPANDNRKFTGFGLKDPDESFYKALNAVHRDSYPNTADANLPRDDHFTPPPPPAPGPTISNQSKVRAEKAPKLGRKQPIGEEKEFQDKPGKGRDRRRNPVEEIEDSPDQEAKSVTSNPSLYSSEVGEFPVPVDSSPTYENLTPVLPGNISAVPSIPGKRRLPQVPPDNRRTRKDGYIGQPDDKNEQKIPKHQKRDEDNISSRMAKTNLERRTSDRSTGSLNEQPVRGRPFEMGEMEVQYDTYPRRKNKRKDKDKGILDTGSTAASSPLTVIDGNVSFSLTEDIPVVQDKKDQNKDRKVDQIKCNDQPTDTALKHQSHSKSYLHDTEEISSSTVTDQLSKKERELAGGTLSQNDQEIIEKPKKIITLSEQDVSSPLEGNVNRASSLYQQIQAREAESLQDLKSRKLSLKEKRKLRAEQRELGSEIKQKIVTEADSGTQHVSMPKKDSSESDVSMRSDHSVSPKRDSGDMELLEQGQQPGFNGLNINDQQGARPRSNGINLLPVQQQILGSSSKSREFAVSRALGKYRQKQKERESLQGSSNSDSQEELDITGTEVKPDYQIEGSIKTVGIKLAGIEESAEPESFKVSLNEKHVNIISPDSVQKQIDQYEQAGFAPFDMSKQPGSNQSKSRSRRQSTEESIDTEDEWYQHEIKRLEQMETESDQKSPRISQSDSLHGRMSRVVEELSNSITVNEQTPILKEQLYKTEPPDKPPDPPDLALEENHEEKEKKIFSKQYASDDESNSSPTASEQDEEDDEEDSETQSGEDTDVDEEEEVAGAASLSDVSKRPGNLVIIPSEPKLNISNIPNKPDLLQEVTAAAAEAAYPEHLKNGSYGEDGLWYDEHGETGYFDEDGTWFDYIDEIGYYNDDGEWIEYDYTKGYWGDDGEWHENEAQKNELDKVSQDKQEPPKDETDHFLWVSEEGIKGKISNDQIPSSELETTMVIGKPPSGLREEQSPPDLCQDSPEVQHKSSNNRWSQQESVNSEPTCSSSPTGQKSDNCVSQKEEFLNDEQEDCISDIGEVSSTVRKDMGKGGKRWGTLIKQHTAELIDLVRI